MVEEFFSDLRSVKRRKQSTVRRYQNALRMFCSYVSDPAYGWDRVCEQRFGSHPAQVFFEWNTATHVQDNEQSPAKRAFTKRELQDFFDHADDQVALIAASGRKGCCLRTGRALRKPQRRADARRGRIPNMVNISQRPPEAADRAVPGHWEGDLILGSTASASAIGTLVKRMTRFVLLLHLPDDHSAAAVQEAIVAKMAALPSILRKTLTWDQGKEMANHVAIAEAAELDIYFCDPHSPWQRGTNENTNGLLRQYFAKGTNLSVFPADYLDYVAAKLNTRPRKTLGWKTPAEALDELLSEPFKPPAVASAA